MIAASGPVLVIAAHPDDEVLGCGGTIARLTGEGRDVSIAILVEGITSRDPQRDAALRSQDLAALRTTAQRVATSLGARELSCFNLPDNRLDSVPLLEIVKLCEQLIARIKPTVVLTQHGGDLNIDHRRIFEAVLAATRPVPGSVVQQVIGYEVASSTEWAFQRIEPVFRPNLFVDISRSLPRKIAAMELYQGEARPFPHPRSAQALEAQAKRWGAVCGVPAAEAFEIVRTIA
jgi:LmbE family N-acetylglucosaminyl deacetylase